MPGRVLIIAARFNELVTKELVAGAEHVFSENGLAKANVELVWVPGAFEIPVAAALAARSKKYQAIVCLGCVIRGETPHFDYVAGEAASGIMKVGIETGVPVIFGVLTTNTVEQALNRSGLKYGNKGRDAAMAALEMIKVCEGLKKS